MMEIHGGINPGVAKMEQMRILQCVPGGIAQLINGNVIIHCSVLTKNMFVMEIWVNYTAEMDQMRILSCVLNGTAPEGAGNVRMVLIV